MKQKNEWEKKTIKTAKLLSDFSFTLDKEIEHHLKENGISDTELLREFFSSRLNLTKKELKKLIKVFVLKECEIKERQLSKQIREFGAKMILKLTTKKEVKNRMEEYLKNKEYAN